MTSRSVGPIIRLRACQPTLQSRSMRREIAANALTPKKKEVWKLNAPHSNGFKSKFVALGLIQKATQMVKSCPPPPQPHRFKFSPPSEMYAPPSFFCPISKQLMEDPVSTSDGHSYEREAIKQWLQKGDIRSPMTGARLTSTTITPVHALRNSIMEWEENVLANITYECLEMERAATRSHMGTEVYSAALRITGAPGSIDVLVFPILSCSIEANAKRLVRLCRHRSIARFHGLCERGPVTLAVVESNVYGPLFKGLKTALKGRYSRLTLRHRIYILKQICDGMEKLRASNISHGILKAKNFLLLQFDPSRPESTLVKVPFDVILQSLKKRDTLDQDSDDMLADFRKGPETGSPSVHVWSYGVIAWEVMSFGTSTTTPKPETQLNNSNPIYTKLRQPEHCPESIWSLIKLCWSQNCGQRPSLRGINLALKSVENDYARFNVGATTTTIPSHDGSGVVTFVRIEIRTMEGRRTTMILRNTQTVADVKRSFETWMGMNRRHFSLMYCGQELNDNLTIEQCRVEGDAVMHLVRHSYQPMMPMPTSRPNSMPNQRSTPHPPSDPHASPFHQYFAPQEPQTARHDFTAPVIRPNANATPFRPPPQPHAPNPFFAHAEDSPPFRPTDPFFQHIRHPTVDPTTGPLSHPMPRADRGRTSTHTSGRTSLNNNRDL